MNRLQYVIRRRRHMARSERTEWITLVVCLLGVALAVALAWARDEQTGDCYYGTGGKVFVGKWRDVNGTDVCEHRNYGR